MRGLVQRTQELFGDKATPLDLGLPEFCTDSAPRPSPRARARPHLRLPGRVGVVRCPPSGGGRPWPQVHWETAGGPDPRTPREAKEGGTFFHSKSDGRNKIRDISGLMGEAQPCLQGLEGSAALWSHPASLRRLAPWPSYLASLSLQPRPWRGCALPGLGCAGQGPPPQGPWVGAVPHQVLLGGGWPQLCHLSPATLRLGDS